MPYCNCSVISNYKIPIQILFFPVLAKGKYPILKRLCQFVLLEFKCFFLL